MIGLAMALSVLMMARFTMQVGGSKNEKMLIRSLKFMGVLPNDKVYEIAMSRGAMGG